MAKRFDFARRLEPFRPGGDEERGFRAEVADPAWFIGRQWQMGEHQGEDAASPVRVDVSAGHTPIDPYDGDPSMDPQVVPAEAIVESEAGDWWTPGRRVRVGLAAAPFVPPDVADDPALKLEGLPPPYDRFNGLGFDGRTLHERRVALGLPAGPFAGVPPVEPADLWDPAELVYTGRFTAGAVGLDIPRHDGGDVDWYSVSADGAVPVPAPLPEPVALTPGRLRYPGAPHPRWWQIENARVDIGGFPPDRSHLATMLLIDLLMSHADDWFTFPVDATAGTVVTLHEVIVTDGFDEPRTLTTPGTWGLFHVHGLDSTSLIVWPKVVTPLTGPVEDEVIVGIDEDANLLWGVERRAAGRELAPPLVEPVFPPAPAGQLKASEQPHYAYRPSTTLPRFWHPYPIEEVAGRRRFVQGRLADLSLRPPVPMPEPVTPLLMDPAAPAAGPVHQIEPATIPSNGLRLERRWMLGRSTNGQPVLWMQRRRMPLLGSPVSGLRFDIADQIFEVSP